MLSRTNHYNHIKVLPANRLGEDIIAADIHGKLSLLKQLIASLNSKDRLFLAGDLIDKGPDSLAVIRFLKQHWESAAKPYIYAVKGNHEQTFIQHAKKVRDHEDTAETAAILNKSRHGGQWTLRLSLEELIEVADVLKELPLIISVNDARPFIVTHADIPFKDDTLLYKYRFHIDLTEKEIHHTLYARKHYTKRAASEILVYCGHEIIIEKPGASIRRLNKSLDLDGGAYATNALIAIKHKHGIPFLVGKPYEKYVLSFYTILDLMDHYLYRPQKSVYWAMHLLNQLIWVLKKDIEKDREDKYAPIKPKRLMPICQLVLQAMNDYMKETDLPLTFDDLMESFNYLKKEATPPFWRCSRFFLPQNKALKKIIHIESFLHQEQLRLSISSTFNKTLND